MTWQYFTRDEFTCNCGCHGNLIEDGFIDRMDELREAVGFALVVTSGYRCPRYNNLVSSTGEHGPHTTGRAADLRVDRKRAFRVLQEASKLGFTGIGVKQKGNGRFIHLDDLENAEGQPRPTIWSY